jgi:hypothetical protein
MTAPGECGPALPRPSADPRLARGLASEAAVDNAFYRVRCAVPKSTGDGVASARVQARYLLAGEETLSILIPYGYWGVSDALVAGDALGLANHTPRIGLSADKQVTRSQREDRYRPHRPAPLRSHTGLPDFLGALRLLAGEGVEDQPRQLPFVAQCRTSCPRIPSLLLPTLTKATPFKDR